SSRPPVGNPPRHIVGRFLALLELFKAKAVDAQQEEALGQLDLSWTGLDVDPAVVAAANWD
ncbi:segregation/condensation protein A, partial [Corynebacterium sp. KPL2838]|uniref:segregation/condensation protein A n=1 Tax=Corynebacterium sp. KPL2838 TaxID=3158316 RepID=UPI0032EED0AA